MACERCEKSYRAWRAAWLFEQHLRLELERQLVLHGADAAVIRTAHDAAQERAQAVLAGREGDS